MERAARAVFHSSSQALVGLAVGSVLDAAFPEPSAGDSLSCPGDALMTLLEIVGQTIAVSVVSSSALEMLNQLPETFDDPQFGQALMFMTFMSQHKLGRKITKLSNYLQEEVGLRVRKESGTKNPNPNAPRSSHVLARGLLNRV